MYLKTLHTFLAVSSVLSGIRAEEPEDEYITFKDQRNIFNSVKSSLEPWLASSGIAGMFAVPATLPRDIVLNTWIASDTNLTDITVFTVANDHLAASFCAQTANSPSNLTTIRTNRAWKLVYFDGSSARTDSTIQNLQRYLLNNQITKNDITITLEKGLCEWIGDRYDGFIDMTDTARLVKCSTTDDSFEVISTTSVDLTDREEFCSGDASMPFSVRDRSSFLSFTALKLHWDYAITAYGKDLPGVADSDAPTLNASHFNTQDKYYFDDELTMVAEVMSRSDLKPTKVNWQGYVDRLAQSYAVPLLALQRSTSATQFKAIINLVTGPYIGSEKESNFELCVARHLPVKSIQQTGTPTEAMLWDVMKGLSSRICSVVLELYTASLEFCAAKETIQELISDLAWSEHRPVELSESDICPTNTIEADQCMSSTEVPACSAADDKTPELHEPEIDAP